ncbi:alpha/beta fold hydrolase [Halapricum hydrolyticum]|uniref:Alpha/beta hydrolase n=1 Tax=Halapricum hydrolyticum TaxID=2979991 RepID=A0AAE3LFT1_9EURY|nr:alpha/beta hydrolase [Halapricum hydrolyticum]MCU4718910.1 alpha/beta hydrolase [Halapricum hydrolyticum]MCU4727997.1 alpha/beta hydrolase [Halapricum hydrolyticum]
MTEDSPKAAKPGDPDGSASFGALYDRAVESLLSVPVSDTWIDSASGRTHLLTAGDPSAQPVIVFQGGNVTNPVTLCWIQTLADDYYLIAPDTPGQPGKTTVEIASDFGLWVVEVLDGLGLDNVAMLGISHGGGIVLEAAVEAPARIDAAALIAPAGFGTSLSLDLVRIVLLSLGYRFLPRQQLLQRALAPMFTQSISTVDETIIETVGTALRTEDLRAEFPGPADPESLAGFEAPTLVITAEQDPFFPGRRTCKRAARHLPSLEECVMLTEERHFLSPAGQHRASERIQTFLGEHTGVTQ